MISRLRFFLTQLGERLWVKPFLTCLLSVGAVFLVKVVDSREISDLVPEISPETIETLLKISASSMLVIATFAVGSMVSSYGSASATATPRSFALIVSDDVSQNALSRFIGAFIFSIVALIALLNEYYDKGALFVLFCLTLLVIMVVVLTFVRWVDCIARLGRLTTTIEKVEEAASRAIKERRLRPHLGGLPAETEPSKGQPIYSSEVGYIQRVDIATLQKVAEEIERTIQVAALPGTFCTPDKPLAYLFDASSEELEEHRKKICSAFINAKNRTFSEDPRFGLIALTEIAVRALSSAVNDPGTAIQVLGSHVRLLTALKTPQSEDEKDPPSYDRVEVPALSTGDLFDDAFRSIARDGASQLEVGIRLQKAFLALSRSSDHAFQKAAIHQSTLALKRAREHLILPEDLQIIEELAKQVEESGRRSNRH